MSGRAIGAAALGLALTALWLRLGVPVVAGRLGEGAGGATGEALFTALVFGPILLLAVAGARVSGVRAMASGVAPIGAAARGAGVGLAALLLAAGFAALAGTVRGSGADGGAGAWWAAGLVVVGGQVLAEEALFRGWLQPVLARTIGVAGAVAITAVAFAALHLVGGAGGAIVFANLLVGGLLFGAMAARGGGIAAAVAAHWAWNAGEQLLLGLDPNPGSGAFGAVLDLDLVGKAAWGGSADGLNGSVAMTLALLAVTVPRLWSLWAPQSGGGGAVGVDRVARPAEPRQRRAG